MILLDLRRRLRTARQSEDSGSALILALLVVLFVGTLFAVVMDYTRAGLEIAPQVRKQRNELNYAQGAVEGAINRIRSSSEAGREDAPCPPFSPEVPTGIDGASGKNFTVSCTGLDPGSTFGIDQPRYAIHATATGTAEGIRVVGGNGELYVDGGIYSHGVAAVTGNARDISMRVNGTVIAESEYPTQPAEDPAPCRGVTSTDGLGLQCGPDSSEYFRDAPFYEPAISGAVTLNTIVEQSHNGPPTCGDGLVEFPAGYYSQPPPELVTEAGLTCANDPWHFAPGIYYFDYDAEWDIGSHQVIAGTMTSPWDGELGGACNTSAPGVQWIFGGGSYITTQAAASGSDGLEVCGPTAAQAFNGSPQRISIYGLSDANDLGTASSGSTTITAASAPTSSVSSSTTAPFLLPANGQTIDGALAAATLARNRTATLTYAAGTLSSAGAVPADAVIDSVTLVASHTKDNQTTATITLTTPTASVPVTFTTNTCLLAAPCEQDITDLIEEAAVSTDLANLSVSYAIAKGNTGGTSAVTVDGFRIEVAYSTPALSALECNSPCEQFFESTTNPNVFIHGTVFTPTADWAVNVHNSGQSIFDRGIIIHDIAITMSASSKQTDSPFQLPKGTPNGRLVLFVATVDGVDRVRACVRYTDHVSIGSTTAAYYGWSLTVPRWHAMRTPSAQAASCA